MFWQEWPTKFNPVTVVRVSLALRIAATALVILADHVVFFALAVAWRSIVSSCTLPAINVLAKLNVVEADRARYFSTLSLINGMCKITAPLIGGALSGIWSPSTPLYVSCALGMLALLFFNKNLVTTFVAHDTLVKTENQNGEDKTSAERLFFYCIGIYFSFVFMVNNLLPLILSMSNHGSSVLGVLVGASGAGNVLTSLYLTKAASSGRSNDDLLSVLRPAIGTALCFSLIGFLISSGKRWQYLTLVSAFVLIGIFSATFSIATNRFLFARLSDRIGAASSKLQAVQNLAILLAPLVGAFVLDHSSPSGLFWIASSTGAVLLLLLYATVSNRSAVRVAG